MENKVKLIGLFSIALLIFTVAAIAISPPAFASKGQVLFTDVNGQPVKGWRTGEMLFVTVIDPDENRDSDEVELIQGTFTDELNEEHPLVEIVDPNTGDRETSAGSLVFQETGVDTGEFRNFPGLYIAALGEGESATPDNGRLEVKDNDTIYVYYTDPSDPSDVDADLAKIGFSYAKIKITDRAGNEVPLFNVGDDVFVTVWDDDENRDPSAVETIEGVTLMNPRMVNEGIAGGVERLTLVETGPNTGVFRNVDGVLLQDFKGSIPQSDTDLVLPVLDKDTIVAFYRAPVIGAAPPPPPTTVSGEVAGQFLRVTREHAASVTPGGSFRVTLTFEPLVDNLVGIVWNEVLPAGSGINIIDSGGATDARITDSTLQLVFASGTGLDKRTVIYEVAVPADYTAPTFDISAAERRAATPTDSEVLGELVTTAQVGASAAAVVAQAVESASGSFLKVTREHDDLMPVGGSLDVTLTFEPLVDNLIGIVWKEVLPDGFGVQIIDSGGATDARLVGNRLQLVFASGTGLDTRVVKYRILFSPTFTGKQFTLTAEERRAATPTDSEQLPQLSTTVQIGAAVAVGGRGDFNDMSDFALDTADIAEPNPSTVTFTDENGVEKNEFRITEDLYITVRDDDENTDSDRAETVHVDVYDVNGGREIGLELVETGLNTGVFRNRDALKLVGADVLPPDQDKPDDGVISVHNRDAIYVVYADKESPTYDPFDISYAWARIYDCEVFTAQAGGPSLDGPQGAAQGENKIWFTSESWVPINKVKKGQELFVKIEECDQNEYSELADSFTVTLYDRHTGDMETVRMVETGPNTGVFHGQGIKMWRPEGGMTPDMVGDGTLQIEDRDTIFVWYQDPSNPGDFALAKAEILPRPIVPTKTPSTTRFTDAQGRDVAKYVVGDTAYVTVEDQDENRTAGVVDTIKDALVVENPRTGAKIKVDLTETGPDTGIFLSEPITTGEEGSGAMMIVAPGDTLKATYTDPDDPTDVSTDDVFIEAAELKVIGYLNQPNPLVTTTLFKVLGQGIQKIHVWVWDLTGKLVYDSGEVPGASLSWDGSGMAGEKLANGVYLYMIQAIGKNRSETSPVRKLVILRH